MLPQPFPSLLLAGALRCGMMIYGEWQDATMRVKYTDIDYHVFSDAARFITQGESPYRRATYRYTPLLAWILTPNIYIHPCFGKLLFVLCDLLAGYLIYHILMRQKCRKKAALFCAQSWLFNPITMAVSTRGNAESLIAVFVLLMLSSLMEGHVKHLILGATAYAVSVHMKIYPVTYALAIYLYIDKKYWQTKVSKTSVAFDLLPNRYRFLAGCTGAVVFALCTGFCYYLYGQEFLQETYLYHITRQDTRHNFSPYFYLFYLMPDNDWLGLLVFIPQAVLIITASWKFHQDLPFCCFLNTMIFVTFNKVCTSQYFLWYLSILPLLIPYIHMKLKKALILCAAWFSSQALWLAAAYQLEFEGKDTFLLIWLAGLLFFAVNVAVIGAIISDYDYNPSLKDNRRSNNIDDMWIILKSTFRKTKEHSS